MFTYLTIVIKMTIIKLNSWLVVYIVQENYVLLLFLVYMYDILITLHKFIYYLNDLVII